MVEKFSSYNSGSQKKQADQVQAGEEGWSSGARKAGWAGRASEKSLVGQAANDHQKLAGLVKQVLLVEQVR